MNELWALLAILLSGFVLLGFITGRGKPSRKRPGGVARRSLTTSQRDVVEKEWEQIGELLSVGRGSSLSSAVIEADKLLDYCLRSLGASGTTLGERLRSAEPRFSDYQGLWQAHKLRNRLVHEHDSDPSKREVEQAVGQFEKALKDLGAFR